MEGTERLIHAREVAQRLGISRAKLSRLVNANRIGVYRIGGRTLFDETILEDFKKRVYVEPQTKGGRE